jgi:hypothetical protein
MSSITVIGDSRPYFDIKLFKTKGLVVNVDRHLYYILFKDTYFFPDLRLHLAIPSIRSIY